MMAELPKEKDYSKEYIYQKTQYYYCHNYGHVMRFCKKKQQDESQEDAKFVKVSEETMFLMIEEDDKDFVDDCVVSLKRCDVVPDEKILGTVSDDVFYDELEVV